MSGNMVVECVDAVNNPMSGLERVETKAADVSTIVELGQTSPCVNNASTVGVEHVEGDLVRFDIPEDVKAQETKVETAVADTEAHQDGITKPHFEKRPNQTSEKEDEDLHNESEVNRKSKARMLVSSPRMVNFEGFKNRFSEDEGIHVLDVLYADSNLMGEVRREREIRRICQNDPVFKRGTRAARTQVSAVPKASIQPKEGSWIQLVRIRSQPVLTHLANVMGEAWGKSSPIVFKRPFKVLIYFHDKMKERLAGLESEWGNQERRRSAGNEIDSSKSLEHEATENGNDAQGSDDENDDDDHPEDEDEDTDEEFISSSVTALRDMQCYVNFVNDHILPLSNMFAGTTRRMVRFDDLWLLFKPGELVWASEAAVSGKPGTRATRMYQRLWRVYTLRTPGTPTEYSKLGPTSNESQPNNLRFSNDNEEVENDEEPVSADTYKGASRVWAYYIDHDGVSYGPVKHQFMIRPYRGEREITSLPCYPIRYVDDWESHLDQLKEQGHKFEQCIKVDKYLTYVGWTLVSDPKGNSMRDTYDRDSDSDSDSSRKQKELSPEYIDSHVIVDLSEAFHDVPRWTPNFHSTRAYSEGLVDSERLIQEDQFPIITWSDEKRSKIIASSCDEAVVIGDLGVTMRQRQDWLERDQFGRFLKGSGQLGLATSIDKQAATDIVLQDEDYALLPRRLFAYVLKERKFVRVDLQHLNPIKTQDRIFDNLKIDKEYKDMVRGLVSSHFEKKKFERQYSVATSRVTASQDIIQGKGNGLVILLHGVPGVGKTATAEAVALEYRKPLFAITCGDLGLTPKEVEESLTEIFRLAHMWDCVLLFDEADVFLAQRSRYDLKRNALVSVFLRILEYYSGVLFLTTNRVGSLDEAFKSRIHLSLYYPPLNSKQFKRIFEMNISKLREIELERSVIAGDPMLDIRDAAIKKFAEEHCDRTEQVGGNGRWNGRQIRNAFQIAASLARYNALLNVDKTGLGQPVLDKEHFEKVERATRTFNDYMEKTRGFSDADLAFINAERLDVYRQKKPIDPTAGLAEAGPSGYSSSQQQQHLYGPPETGQQHYYAHQNPATGVQFPALQPGPITYGPSQAGEAHGEVGSAYGAPALHHHPNLRSGKADSIQQAYNYPQGSASQAGRMADPFFTNINNPPSSGPPHGYHYRDMPYGGGGAASQPPAYGGYAQKPGQQRSVQDDDDSD
ncbi:hypothetical protein N656DRAFT_625556 [Canariomyces notabilis]|uniref:AAA+ ATPase domain-containing protein n=1 Tax=Canariomyces notabilis TaxID=2074819 RepID=A0AAN6YUH5_9PEZI|nr:hypothetical protein N656DRAFT_625556 [Canariomyces arenarius]